MRSSPGARQVGRALLVPSLAALFAIVYLTQTRDLPGEARRFPDVFVLAVLLSAAICAAVALVRLRLGAPDVGEDVSTAEPGERAAAWRRRSFWAFWLAVPAWAILATQVGFYVSAWALLTVLGTLLRPPSTSSSPQGRVRTMVSTAAIAAAIVLILYVLVELVLGVWLPRPLLI